MVLNPNHWFKRKITKIKNSIKRTWTRWSVEDGTIYRIDNKMYQVYDGRYILIGTICHMCESLDIIKNSDLITL